MCEILVKVFLLPSQTDITIQQENVRLLFGCALQISHQHSLSSLLIKFLPGYESPGFAHKGGSTSHGTGHHGSQGRRDRSVSVLGGSVCHCAITSKLQVTPATRMRGLGARYQNSHIFGRDTGVTIDILLKIHAGVLIFIFLELDVKFIKYTKSKPRTLRNDRKEMSHYDPFTQVSVRKNELKKPEQKPKPQRN